MAAPMEVTHKLLDGVSLAITQKILKFCLKIHVLVIRRIRCQVNFDYHNQHESAALIGLFHATSSVLPSVESYWNYWKTDAERSTGVPLALLSAAESIVAVYQRISIWPNIKRNKEANKTLEFPQ